MPISEDSLIAPDQPGAKPPLKKSTVGWIAGGLFALAVVGVALPAVFSSAPPPPPIPEPKSTNQPAGNPAQIDQEVREAKTRASAPVRSASAAASGTLPFPPLPNGSPGGQLPPGALAGGPVVPGKAKRDDNSAALYGRAGDVPVEIEAAARQSASIKHDFGQVETKSAPVQGDPTLDRLRAALGSQPAASAAGGSDGDRTRDRVLAAMEAERRGTQSTTGVTADRSWLKEMSGETQRANPPIRTYKVANPYTLLQGKTIPAVLTRELNSDLPGLVAACTTLPVYDSISGNNMLIPRGSCFQGQYSNAIGPGQERLLFAFSRLCMPDGTCVDLAGAPGADVSGAAGVDGSVNNHFFKMFTTSFLVAILADRAESNKTVVQSSNSSGPSGPATAAGQVLVDVSRSILDRNRTIPPTITIAKGTRINVEVTRDIEFAGPYQQRPLP